MGPGHPRSAASGHNGQAAPAAHGAVDTPLKRIERTKRLIELPPTVHHDDDPPSWAARVASTAARKSSDRARDVRRRPLPIFLERYGPPRLARPSHSGSSLCPMN